jgi:hypothetical protein
MKKSVFYFSLFILFLITSCSSFDNGLDKPKLGGDTNLAANKVGFEYTGFLYIDGNYKNSNTTATVISNEDGVIEVQAKGTLLPELMNLVKSSPYVDPDGTVEISAEFVNSSEGLAYVNAKGEESILVEYDAKVGDSWKYTTKGGKKIERKVISRSTDDDFFWAGMMIKVIEIEQNLPYPGFTKAIYRANHKFGLVNVEVYTEDGKVVSVNL